MLRRAHWRLMILELMELQFELGAQKILQPAYTVAANLEPAAFEWPVGPKRSNDRMTTWHKRVFQNFNVASTI